MNERSILWKSMQSLCRIGTSVCLDLKVYNLHYIPKQGGVLIIANHQSFLDPVVQFAQFRRPVSFLARHGLFDNRYFGWLIRNLHAFPVRQGETDVGAIRETIRRLQEGHVLNIYPEGSRSDDGEIARIMPGIALLVRKAEVPVVPAAIIGSYEAWPKGRKFFRCHPVRVMYGPPLQLDGLRPAEVVQLIDRTLRQMFEELKQRERQRTI